MKHAEHEKKRPFANSGSALLALAATAAFSSSCVRSSSHSDSIEVLRERETNDFAFEANDFGILRPGDFLVVQGDITDIPFDPFDPFNGHDPFDGFSFTANEPIVVEFRLFANGPADLDVCLYDPFLDLDVACYQTPNDPEFGTVEVLAGGVDFHLVIESFSGISSYDLELEVFPLHASTAARPDSSVAAAPDAAPATLRMNAGASEAKAEDGRSHDAFRAYFAKSKVEAPDEPYAIQKIEVIEFDEATGELRRATLMKFSDGSLQAVPTTEQ